MHEYISWYLRECLYIYLSYGIVNLNINCDILFASTFSFLKHMTEKDGFKAENINNDLIFKKYEHVPRDLCTAVILRLQNVNLEKAAFSEKI